MHYSADKLLHTLGQRVRSLRQGRGWTQNELARRAGVSPRFLLEVEKGDANISLLRLTEVSAALEVSLATLVGGLGPAHDDADRLSSLSPERRARALEAGCAGEKVALVGLRGAGKSAVGTRLGELLELPFIELDHVIEQLGGLHIGEIFKDHGVDRYRDLERAALDKTLAQPGGLVLAVGGSAVTAPETWARIRRATRTVWLKASPETHLRRVENQGDFRPMHGRRDALTELRHILTTREQLYAQAEHALDTEGLAIDVAAHALADWLRAVAEAERQQDAAAPVEPAAS